MRAETAIDKFTEEFSASMAAWFEAQRQLCAKPRLQIQQVDDSLAFEARNHEDQIDHEDGDRGGFPATNSALIPPIVAVKDSLQHADKESPIEVGVAVKEVQIQIISESTMGLLKQVAELNCNNTSKYLTSEIEDCEHNQEIKMMDQIQSGLTFHPASGPIQRKAYAYGNTLDIAYSVFDEMSNRKYVKKTELHCQEMAKEQSKKTINGKVFNEMLERSISTRKVFDQICSRAMIQEATYIGVLKLQPPHENNSRADLFKYTSYMSAEPKIEKAIYPSTNILAIANDRDQPQSTCVGVIIKVNVLANSSMETSKRYTATPNFITKICLTSGVHIIEGLHSHTIYPIITSTGEAWDDQNNVTFYFNASRDCASVYILSAWNLLQKNLFYDILDVSWEVAQCDHLALLNVYMFFKVVATHGGYQEERLC